jgi:hypothetical protein
VVREWDGVVSGVGAASKPEPMLSRTVITEYGKNLSTGKRG